MNPQYLPPQQFGGPPQQFGGPPQGFPLNRASPNATQQSFQNVPLGSQKPPQGDHLPPPPSSNILPPSSQPGQITNLGGPVPRSQIPSNQLPPSSGNDTNNSFGLSSGKLDNLSSANSLNGPPSFQIGPPQFVNGQTGNAPSQPNRLPSNFATPQSNQNNFGPPPTSSQNAPPRPPSTQSNQPLLPGGPSSHFCPPPSLSQSTLQTNSTGQPFLKGGPLSLGGHPSVQGGSSPLGSQPPLQTGPPSLGGQPPVQGGPPPLGGQPSLQGGVLPLGGQQPLQGGPSPLGGQPPLQGGPPLLGGQPPLQSGPPPLGGHLSLQSGPPPLGQPPLPGGPVPLGVHSGLSSGPSPSAGQFSLHSGSSAGGLTSLQSGPGGQPGFQVGPPSSGGLPSLQAGVPPSQFGRPPSGPPSHFGHQSVAGPPQSQTGSFAFSNQSNGPNQPPNQYGSSIQNQNNNPLGPPKPGQYPPPSRPGHPLPTGQSPFQNATGPYPPSGTGSGPQMPPLPDQTQYGPNQLSNHMQGMNMSGPKQMAGLPGSMRGGMNGDTGPHMPPPIGQPGITNNQQGRLPPGPGFPPMPGQPPLPGQASMPGQAPIPGQYASAAGGYPQPNYQQPQQNRRLDPDQMPSPIQVIQDDQHNRSGVFITNQKGLVPPLVTTNFVVQDQGNCSPRFIRSSMYNVPISQDMVKQTAVPFSLVISPMAKHVDQEYPPPIVNFGTLGPVRCIRCKAYMCPFMQFVDSGRRFQCLFCMATTDVPTEYFQHLDHTGQRMDRYERPELILGTYEFVATAEYCRNNTLPKPPALIFVIDVSYNNVKSGMVNLICSQMKDILQNLPTDQGQEKSNMRVGFITYNSSVHFYNIKGTLAAPQMLVVGDVQEMFMPLLDGFLCTPEESGQVIDLLMQQIPTMFGDTRETETVLLPAIQAGLEALKASECVGKLLVFHSTLPTAEAPGKLKNRDDRKLLGTDKEKTVLSPQTQAYNQLGQECVGAGCSVDLFIFNNSYIDLATIGQVSRLTGGEIFKYTYFQSDIDGERLINDIILDISRPIAFDAVMRVRTSTGVRPTDFYGHFYMSNTTDIELAAVDCDKAIGVEIKHDDKLSEEAGVYIQTALLYTSSSGQRRLRIMNLSLKTCSQMADLYRSCDLDTIINYISKQACYKLLDNNPKAVKDSIVNRAAQILATYRKNCANPSSAGQLILPECMKLLPLYVNCLLKNDALSGGSDMTLDDRSFVMQAVMTMDVPTSVHFFYPRLIPLNDIDPTSEDVSIPSPIRCTIEKMNEQGVYILENGIHMFLWFGLGVNPDFIQKLFGASSAIQVDLDRVSLPELDNPLSVAIRNIVDEIRIQRHRCMRLTLVRQREKLEPVLKHFLIEDRGNDGSPSYVDFLCHMHKEIRTLLS